MSTQTDLNKLVEQIVNLSIKEVQQLATILKEEHGIEPAAPVVVAAAAGQGDGGADEKTNFDVILKAQPEGTAKMKVIKYLKDKLEFGLKDAMGIVKSAPQTLKEGVAKEEAETLKKELEEIGAAIELK